MPIQTFNFNSEPIPTYINQGSGYEDMFSNMLKGYEMSQKPGQMARKKEEILANKLKGSEIQGQGHKNKTLEAEAQNAGEYFKNRAQKEAYGGFSGDVGQIMQLEMAKAKYGPGSPIVQKIEESMNLSRQSKEVLNKQRESTTANRSWNSLPASEKLADLAKARGLQFSDQEYIDLRSQGKTWEDLEKIAESRGVDVKNAHPIHNPTTANITKMKDRDAFAAETRVIGDFTTKGLAPYVQKFAGYSPAQIWDHVKGDNKDQLADFYAARMIEEEGAVLALKQAGANVGVHTVDNIVNKGMGNTKVFPAQMTPEIFSLARKKARDTLLEAAEAAKAAYNNEQYNYDKKLANNPKAQDKELGNMLDQKSFETMTEEELKAQGAK